MYITYPRISFHHQNPEILAQLQGAGLKPKGRGGAHAAPADDQHIAALGQHIASGLAAQVTQLTQCLRSQNSSQAQHFSHCPMGDLVSRPIGGYERHSNPED